MHRIRYFSPCGKDNDLIPVFKPFFLYLPFSLSNTNFPCLTYNLDSYNICILSTLPLSRIHTNFSTSTPTFIHAHVHTYIPQPHLTRQFSLHTNFIHTSTFPTHAMHLQTRTLECRPHTHTHIQAHSHQHSFSNLTSHPNVPHTRTFTKTYTRVPPLPPHTHTYTHTNLTSYSHQAMYSCNARRVKYPV